MENCMLVKLKGASTNEDLPVFETILGKEWIKTTADNQYVLLVNSYTNKRHVYDFTFRANSSQMGEGYHCIVGNTSGYYIFEIAKGENDGEGIFRYSLFGSGSGNVTGTVSCTLDEEHNVSFNPIEQVLTIDGNDISLEKTTTSTATTGILLFGSGSTPSSKTGAISIGEFTLRNYTSGYPVRNDWKPYIINGEAFLSDREKDNTVSEANGGELEAYDDEE